MKSQIMNAELFLEKLKEKVISNQPSGSASEWTEAMSVILTAIGTENQFHVYKKKAPYEINHVDYMYTHANDDQETNWNPPEVVIEHENAWNIEETRWDFWKACLYAAPLRVTFGYMNYENDSRTVGDELVQFYLNKNLRQLPNGETLLIMGWKQETGRSWHTWKLAGSELKFTYKLLNCY